MRIRTIKPEFWTDKKISDLSHFSRLLFIGLWNYSDDEGRFRADPRIIKGALFPVDDTVDSEKVTVGLRELSDKKMIRLYTVADENYGDVPNFKKHQVINHPSKKHLPKFPEDSGSTTVGLRIGSGNGKGIGNGKGEESGPQPRPGSDEKKVPGPQKETWLTPFANVWQEILGGEIPFGQAAKVLKSLVDRNGPEKVADHLRNYLKATDAQFVSLPRFAATFGKWNHSKDESPLEWMNRRAKEKAGGGALVESYRDDEGGNEDESL